MSLVVDLAAVLALAMEDEAADYAEAVLDEVVRESAAVPAIFWFEVRNVLVVNERRGRIAPRRSDAFLAALSDLPLEVAALPSDLAVLSLAREHRLTVYDASYLDLAGRLGVPLASLDRQLCEAAGAAGVAIFEP